MRVIGGTARSIRLVRPSSAATRPLSDRAREALFNIVGAEVVGVRFLDLFAGTGAVGIEALSRDAESAVFVETDPDAVADIEDNLARTGLEDRARVRRQDVFRFLERDHDPFDLVFVGPPQWHGLWSRSLAALSGRPTLTAPEALVVVQLHAREDDPEAVFEGLERTDTRAYGKVTLAFYRRR